MGRKKALTSAVPFLLLAGLQAEARTARPKEGVFKSASHGFSVQYPEGWYPQIIADVFYIENFPPWKAARGVRLPEGGAGIKILVPSQTTRSGESTPKTLADWVSRDLRGQSVLSRADVDIVSGTRQIRASEVKTLCCAVAPFLETVTWYFEIRDRLFSASLIYWAGDQRVETWRLTMKRVVLSIEVVDKR
jgi:hypothetical protein